ncbi:MAG: O-methyltransferase [Bacteroidota bacterium]
MKQFLPTEILHFAEQMSPAEPELLAALRRETHVKVLYPQMLSSSLQGRFLSFFSHVLRPSRILEVGTYTGYSCICLAEGLAPEGRITTIEINPERKTLIQKYLEKAELLDKVELRIGSALEILPGLTDTYDLAFLDADKAHYPEYVDMIVPLLAPHGMLIIDNVLWHGKVLQATKMTKEVKGIRKMLKAIQSDPRIEQVFLPLWDGWSLVRKMS